MGTGIQHFARTTPRAFAASLLGAALAIGSVQLFHTGLAPIAIMGLVIGIVLEFGGVIAHDRWHLRHDDAPHAMWGPGDARRPRILGGPRVEQY